MEVLSHGLMVLKGVVTVIQRTASDTFTEYPVFLQHKFLALFDAALQCLHITGFIFIPDAMSSC